MIGLLMLVATANVDSGQTVLFGVARYSCATAWNLRHQNSSSAWVMGFWSDMNMATRGQNVGGSTDGNEIGGEVKLFCKASDLLRVPAFAGGGG
jgi:hypothetical protein